MEEIDRGVVGGWRVMRSIDCGVIGGRKKVVLL